MRFAVNAFALAILVFLGTLAANASAQERAHGVLKNSDGKAVGTAGLRETKQGVLVSLQISALPAGLHAVHIHGTGKCEAPAFTSAGGHFNPLNMKHGLKSSDGPHAGDLPDLYVNKDGTGRYEALMESITLSAGKTSVFDADGSAIVVHALPDDNSSDPAGNSGDRIACGVIEKGSARSH
jgi:superoxide dismutase, Cu-Zn family